jgi:hypothetical protein
MFVQYNRSGQHDDDKDEWLSDKENRRWARAASWKNPGTNSIIRHQQAMIYSIALLDICDFESIGRKMPKGTGVDASINDGSVARKHKVRRRINAAVKKGKENKQPKTDALASALAVGSVREAKMSALRMFLEFGTPAEKLKAKQELHLIAYGATELTVNNNAAVTDEVLLDNSTDDDSEEHKSATGSEDETDSL